ncbi:MAG: hypothetical protein DIZ78_03125 [endosymbiont of Escarpia spicata]|uniref:Uncharacterized protein n=1 Tax=endosymbiont of Escarpia spicata TaxID=2200908 RepID=A0A370DSY3_9GAMM|nr:MAG: hypothetical protein DIZ78_03125 [endosymbiont of Escarpia spicata]
MVSASYKILTRFLETHTNNPALNLLNKSLKKKLSLPSAQKQIDEILPVYQTSIQNIEKDFLTSNYDDALIEWYHLLFQEMESHITLTGRDSRHKFVIIIPVADRPQHLRNCLKSLLNLCQSFQYGGFQDHKFNKVSVIIADDSKHSNSILDNREISHYFNVHGLETLYFGQDEQLEQIAQLTNEKRKSLSGVLGSFDRSAFYHKGPSLMRNIVYLKLNEMSKQEESLLFYFVDSDQEFRARVHSDNGDKDIYAINYFYELDRAFSSNDISVLTGKVVGDPPVSPSVMTGTFLDDVIAFLLQMAESGAGHSCLFHQATRRNANEAAYHDMANLFGFTPTSNTYRYNCTLDGKHENCHCFVDFSSKLNQFFYGEHPTRKSYFSHKVDIHTTTPARTVYTGNYIFNKNGLSHFIPFASLKLRMAGPVLGRLIRSELEDQFVSANLPMLHNRTVEKTGRSEFRPGIEKQADNIDLSGEFERQFFGDVMLFTIEKLAEAGYPIQMPAKAVIVQTLDTTEENILRQYTEKRTEIVGKLEQLKTIFSNKDSWWNQSKAMEPAAENFNLFINNIENNFGKNSRCYALINSTAHRKKRNDDILNAILQYREDRKSWKSALAARE